MGTVLDGVKLPEKATKGKKQELEEAFVLGLKVDRLLYTEDFLKKKGSRT